jgi:hypothetical protein
MRQIDDWSISIKVVSVKIFSSNRSNKIKQSCPRINLNPPFKMQFSIFVSCVRAKYSSVKMSRLANCILPSFQDKDFEGSIEASRQAVSVFASISGSIWPLRSDWQCDQTFSGEKTPNLVKKSPKMERYQIRSFTQRNYWSKIDMFKAKSTPNLELIYVNLGRFFSLKKLHLNKFF